MKPPRIVRLLPLTLVVVLISLAACGGKSDDTDGFADVAATETTTTTTTATTALDADDTPDVDIVCAELQTVQELSEEVAQSVNDILGAVAAENAGSEAGTLQAFVDLGDQLEADLPELLAAYDRAAVAAPADVAEEIRAVAAGTALLTPALAAGFRDAAQAGEFVDIEGVLGDSALQEASQRAGLASLRLDSFTNPTCGFQFSNI